MGQLSIGYRHTLLTMQWSLYSQTATSSSLLWLCLVNTSGESGSTWPTPQPDLPFCHPVHPVLPPRPHFTRSKSPTPSSLLSPTMCIGTDIHSLPFESLTRDLRDPSLRLKISEKTSPSSVNRSPPHPTRAPCPLSKVWHQMRNNTLGKLFKLLWMSVESELPLMRVF